MDFEKAKALCRTFPGPAPCLARAKRMRVESAAARDDHEAAALLRRSYELVFARLTKKLQRELGGAA